jgi:hypothetical protein
MPFPRAAEEGDVALGNHARRILVFGAPARLLREIAVPAAAAADRDAVEHIRDEIRGWISKARRGEGG